MSFNINTEISNAKTLPAEFYLDHQYFNFCLENIFPSSWQFIADIDTLQQNSIFPFTFLIDSVNEPLVLINHCNKIKCFSNVCTHRAHLVVDKPCSSNKLRCIYHGRTFNLDGSFNSMPGFEEVQNFPTEKDDLISFPLINWENFIFVSLKGEINIISALNDIKRRLPYYPFKDLIYNKNSSQSWEIAAHWALYCENYLEGFHIPFVHKRLAKEIDLCRYETVLIENAVLQIAKGKEDYKEFHNPENPNQKIYGLYYWIFPNLMLNFYSWGLSVNIIEPISANRTQIRFLSYPNKNKKQPKDVGTALNQVETEDQSVVLNVQKGIQSRFYKSGRYSSQHERGLHHFHLLLSKYLT